MSPTTLAHAVAEVTRALEPIFTFPEAEKPNVHRRKAPQTLPTSQGGLILPGVIIRVRTPVPVAEDGLDGTQRLDARVHRFQTLLFAENDHWLDEAVDHVAFALSGLRIGDYSLRHSVEDDPTQPIHDDPHLDRPYTYNYWQFIG